MAKGSTVASSGDMHKGLTNKSPPTQDSSRKLGKTSVNSDACRHETAPAEKTIGPRTA